MIDQNEHITAACPSDPDPENCAACREALPSLYAVNRFLVHGARLLPLDSVDLSKTELLLLQAAVAVFLLEKPDLAPEMGERERDSALSALAQKLELALRAERSELALR